MIVGLGVDILSLKRARQFFSDHKDGRAFLNFLSCEEIKDISKGSEWTPFVLAKYFTAKEAFFKASSLNVFQWDQITVKIRDSYFDAYSVTSANSLISLGCYFIEDEYVGAQMIIYGT